MDFDISKDDLNGFVSKLFSESENIGYVLNILITYFLFIHA